MHNIQFKKYNFIMQTSKKSFYFLSFIFLLILSCDTNSKQIDAGKFHLKIEIDGISKGTKVLLKKQESNSTILMDSAVVDQNKVEFKGSIDTPLMLGVFLDDIPGKLLVLVDQGTTFVTVHKDSLFAPTINGSKLNDELQEFKKGSEKIVSKIGDLFIQIQKARAENDLQKINEINNKMRAINDENTRYSLNYAKNNPNSFISSIVLQSVLRIPEVDVEEVNIIYSGFSEDVKKSEYSKNIFNFLASNTTVRKDSIE